MNSSLLTRRQMFASLLRPASPVAEEARFVSPLTQAAVGRAHLEKSSQRLPDCEVLNQRGEQRRLVSDLIAGQRVMIGFIYTNCRGICPRTTEHMAEASRVLQRRGVAFRMLSISVDPAQYRPADLALYAEINGADAFPHWDFVVASPADTLALRRALKLVDPNPARDAEISNHSGLLILGNDRTDRWGAIPAGAEPIHIANTFERLTRDQSLRAFTGLSPV